VSDPYLIEGPALISFSGGRTSGYMLKQILDRGLQPDVHVTFANTGKEDDRTLEFVRDVQEHWGVPIRWLEYRRQFLPRHKSEKAAASSAGVRKTLNLVASSPPVGESEPGYIEVNFETAARTTDPPTLEHPFTNMIAMHGVPNAAFRLCTTELKIRVMKKFMMDQGYDNWTNIVGIRADEPRRVARMRVTPKERWENAVPLADAKVVLNDVLDFWLAQPFDLNLANDEYLGTYEGNCDLCHLKSDGKKVRSIREQPERAVWWSLMEEASGSFFRPRTPLPVLQQLASDPNYRPSPDDAMTELGDCICHD
jgi:3'-phosphoadenosine 5'-phosphosulfate sulfotransferase (PAPS reductase)/FAD synthetase